MNAAFVVGGIEIAIAAPSGPLERLICDRYAWFLHRITRPQCWLTIGPMAAAREASTGHPARSDGDGGLQLDHPWFEGHVAANHRGEARVLTVPSAVDALFMVVVAAMAPQVGTVMVDGAGVSSSGRGHLLVGAAIEPVLRRATVDRRPVIGPVRVVLSRRDDAWLLSGTPFGAIPRWPERSADLAAVWLVEEGSGDTQIDTFSGAGGAGVVAEHAVFPVWDAGKLEETFDLCAQIGAQVPSARLPAGAGQLWDRIDELGAALGVRRALSTPQPELQARLLRTALGFQVHPRPD